jgi:hypothetical protein
LLSLDVYNRSVTTDIIHTERRNLMGKLYLEVVTSKYCKGTSMRDKSTEYVELNIDCEIPERFESVDQINETNAKILEVIETYANSNDVVLGIEYNNAMVSTNMYQDQKYSKHVFVERSEGYFRNLLIENNVYMEINPITFNWTCFHREYWELKDNSFRVAKRS